MAETDQQPLVEVPQFGVLAADKDIYLTVAYATMQQQVYLCNITNYEQVARKIHKAIMDAGVQAKRAATGLTVVQGGDVDAAVRDAKRRQ